MKDFVGSYSGYRQYLKDREEERRAASRESRKDSRPAVASADKPERKRRLTYKEKMEKEQLEKDLASLGEEKSAIEGRLCSGTLTSEQLTADSIRIGEVNDLIDSKELRWLELDEIENS